MGYVHWHFGVCSEVKIYVLSSGRFMEGSPRWDGTGLDREWKGAKMSRDQPQNWMTKLNVSKRWPRYTQDAKCGMNLAEEL